MPMYVRHRVCAYALLVLCILGVAACGAGPTSTSAASATPSGPTVLFQDALTPSSTGWSSDADCVLKSDGFHFTASVICFAPADDARNVDISVQARQVSGPTTVFYGIVFRHASTGNYYQYNIDSNGKWTFLKSVGGNVATVVPFTANAAIKAGLNATNTLEVRAVGATLTFFVNGTQVGQTRDTTYTSGSTGLIGDDGIEVVNTQFKMTAAS